MVGPKEKHFLFLPVEDNYNCIPSSVNVGEKLYPCKFQKHPGGPDGHRPLAAFTEGRACILSGKPTHREYEMSNYLLPEGGSCMINE